MHATQNFQPPSVFADLPAVALRSLTAGALMLGAIAWSTQSPAQSPVQSEELKSDIMGIRLGYEPFQVINALNDIVASRQRLECPLDGAVCMNSTNSTDRNDIKPIFATWDKRIVLGSFQVAENRPGAVVGNLQTSGLNVGDQAQYSVNDDRFFVGEQNQLLLSEGVSLNYEEENSIDLQITSTDETGYQVTSIFTIIVLDAPELPTAINLSNRYISVGVGGGEIGKLSVVDEDQNSKAEGAHKFTVIGSDRFEVIGKTLILSNEPTDKNQEFEVQISAIDTGMEDDANEISNTFNIFTAFSTDENQEGAKIIDLQAVDPLWGDPSPSNRYKISVPDNPQLEAKLGIRDGWLQVVRRARSTDRKVFLDYERDIPRDQNEINPRSEHVEVQITKYKTARQRNSGLEKDDKFRIRIRDLNEKPTDIDLFDQRRIEYDGAGARIGTLRAKDEDFDETFKYAVADARFEIRGERNNELWLRSGAVFGDANNTIAVPITATDREGAIGGLSFTKSFNVVVNQNQRLADESAARQQEIASQSPTQDNLTPDPDAVAGDLPGSFETSFAYCTQDLIAKLKETKISSLADIAADADSDSERIDGQANCLSTITFSGQVEGNFATFLRVHFREDFAGEHQLSAVDRKLYVHKIEWKTKWLNQDRWTKLERKRIIKQLSAFGPSNDLTSALHVDGAAPDWFRPINYELQWDDKSCKCDNSLKQRYVNVSIADHPEAKVTLSLGPNFERYWEVRRNRLVGNNLHVDQVSRDSPFAVAPDDADNSPGPTRVVPRL
jgi:hypothetical protein